MYRIPRMCGWGSGAHLTGRNMREHSAICPKRLATSDHGDGRRNSKVKRGRPQGPLMKCGSGLRLPAYRSPVPRSTSPYPPSGRRPPSTGTSEEGTRSQAWPPTGAAVIAKKSRWDFVISQMERIATAENTRFRRNIRRAKRKSAARTDRKRIVAPFTPGHARLDVETAGKDPLADGIVVRYRN
jgi:hypothetical protein